MGHRKANRLIKLSQAIFIYQTLLLTDQSFEPSDASSSALVEEQFPKEGTH
jgi:hypothetical protein